MKISNFIVVDDLGKAKSKGQAAVNGQVYVPIGTSIPVILKGKGCIGIGIVNEIRMRSDSTLILFQMETEISDASKRAYYDLYRNQNTFDAEDAYDNSDVIIPGAMASNIGNAGRPKWSSNVSSRNRRDESPSLGDYLDEDFDDDPYNRRKRR